MITTDSIKIFAYAHSGIVPLRKADSDTAEMVSQVLLGETMQVLETRERWLRVICDLDGYEGWVSVAQVVLFDNEHHYIDWKKNQSRKSSPFYTYRISRGKTRRTVPAGSPVIFRTHDVELPDGRWDVDGSPIALKEHALMDTAMQLLGVPYLWGGRTDAGIDCSGFIQLVFGLHKYRLPRDAWQQFECAPVKPDPLEDAQYGDVIYFHGKDGKRITHVGFYLGEGRLLHASGNVQIQLIDPDRRHNSRYILNETLAGSIAGFQSFSDLKVAGSLAVDVEKHIVS
jgi:gamma-D-glutamyl-L-lysine dipeptidyl-peptidase